MDVIRDKYERWLRSIKPEDTPDELYEKAEEEARLMDYMAEDISLLSKDLKEFEKEEFFACGGFYLSALSNSAQEREIILHVQDIGKKISSLGYKNKKVLAVEGDIGNLGGYKMEGGKMVVKGRAARSVGKEMRGGEILIKGNAGYWVGEGMTGGKITIEGNVGDIIGLGMENGEIAVHGNAGNYVGRYMKGGSITIMGDVEHWLGQHMSGGEIVVKGDARNAVGNLMRGGRIIIEGNAGELVGWNMPSGEIWVKGTIKSIYGSYQIIKFFEPLGSPENSQSTSSFYVIKRPL